MVVTSIHTLVAPSNWALQEEGGHLLEETLPSWTHSS